ncbi:hypothetical protein [Phytoactinopolyspora mesophila]|uniref:Uncharacterized protein n=1 Tax=Phytoactinopolyspora mesophila TaxID=2650750 RepID=A0A7K3LZT2_9ACTN|nr:hypothetical protein [Phytoactinopolyspora mesophila]NDL56519.1 hypothetical protein [Phytoactinopolyspora mesophila]
MPGALTASAAPFRRRRVLRAAALAVCVAFFGAPAAIAASVDEEPVHAATVEEIIEHLRDDPILVQPSMGMGDSLLAHDVLSEAAAGADIPVYVVLAHLPDEVGPTEQPAEQVAILLREELGDGIFHVDFLESPSAYTGIWGAPDDFDLRNTYMALREAEARGPGEYPRASALFEAVLVVRAAATAGAEPAPSVVDEYASQPWAFIPDFTKPVADAKADRWVATLSTASGVLVAGLIVTTGIARAKPLRAKAGAQARRPAYEAVPEGMPMRARKRLDKARRRFDALSGTELTSEAGELAATAIQAAERVLDTGDELDSVGAYVLALTAEREVDRVREPERQVFRPCLINPLHGEARDTVRVDGSSIDAPVCSACGRRQGAFLSVRKRVRGWEPYVDTSTVWARTGYGALVGDLAEQVLADRSARR